MKYLIIKRNIQETVSIYETEASSKEEATNEKYPNLLNTIFYDEVIKQEVYEVGK